MSNMAQRAFPKTLYVKVEKDSNVTYFVADADAGSLAETERQYIATYALVEIRSVKLVPEFDK